MAGTPYLDTTALDGFSKHADVVKVRDEANALGKFNAATTHFESTPKPGSTNIFDRIRDMFSGGAPATANGTKELSDSYEKLITAQNTLDYAKKNGGDTAKWAADVEKHKAELTGHAEQVFPKMHDAKNAHISAHNELINAKNKAAAEANKRFAAEHAAAANDAARLAATENHKATLDSIEAHFKPELDHHTGVVTQIKEMESKVEEHTKLSAKDIIAKSGKQVAPEVALAGAEKKAAGNIVSRTWQGLKNAPTGNKVGAGVGAIIIGSGLVDAAKMAGVMPKDVDDQGKEVPNDSGKLITTVAKLGAGAAAIYMATKNHMPVAAAKGLA